MVAEGWPSVSAASPEGWTHESIAATQRRKWPGFLELIRAPRPLSVSHEAPVPDDLCVASHNAIMSYGYALAIAARGVRKLSILDFGCGVGHYLPLSRELLPGVEFEYTGFDMPELCDVGREFNPGARFFSQMDQCWSRTYDFVLASGSLQYSREWKAMLTRLASVTRGHLFLTRVPSVENVPQFVIRQRAHAYGYHTEYSGWVFNGGELVGVAEKNGLSLLRRFLMLDAPAIADAPEQVRYRGFLFSRTAPPDDV